MNAQLDDHYYNHIKSPKTLIDRTHSQIVRFYNLIVPFNEWGTFMTKMRYLYPDIYRQCLLARKEFMAHPNKVNADEWVRLSKRLILKSLFKHRNVAF